MLLLFFLLILLKNSGANKVCKENDVRFEANITYKHFYEDGADLCEYIFAPKINESVVLPDILCDYDVDIWLIFVREGFEEEEIYLGNIRDSYCYYDYKYESPKSTGIRVKFYNREGYGIRFDFSRNENPAGTCDFPIQNLIANQNQSIILKKQVNAEKCVYRLIPPENSKDFNEILLEDMTGHPRFEIRRHDENGTILEAEVVRGTRYFARQILDVYSAANSANYRMELRASLAHKSCNCGPSEISTNSTLTTIRSPGYPKANCHHRKCTYILDFESLDNPNTVIFFKFVTDFESEDRLRIHDYARDQNINFHSKKLPKTFSLTPRNLDIEYQASSKIADRSFEINITKIDILERCRCSSFGDKIYHDLHGKIELKIPKSCRNIFCHWKIEHEEDQYDDESHNERLVFEIALQSENPTDFLTFNQQKIYKSPHKSIFSTKDFPVDIDFQRFKMDILTDTHITMTWNTTTDCICPTPFIQMAENQSIILTSPNYPDKYCGNMNCQINLKSENGTQIEIFVEKLELENFHDYLRIDKNSIELTGTYRNYTILMGAGKSEVDLRFESDSSEESNGFLIILRARKMEEEGFSKIPIFLLFFVILILLGSGFFKYRNVFLNSGKHIGYQNYAVE